jgi:predicted DNA repair protein MutK
MFLVGAGILVHGLPFLHHFVHGVEEASSSLPTFGSIAGALVPTLVTLVIGVIVGGAIVGLLSLGRLLRRRPSAT